VQVSHEGAQVAQTRSPVAVQSVTW
jgi:hypothetical protein